MRRMIQGLHRLPPLRLLADPATQLTQPPVGDWCAAAVLWNNPLLDLRLVGPGNAVVPMAERVACRALQMHGIVTLGHLLRASDLMAPPLTGPQFANGVRRAAFPVFTEAVGPLHACQERVARCLRQQPLPAWEVAARQCVPPPPPQTAFAQQALRHVGWQRPGGDVLLTSITVRNATAMQLDRLEAERDARFAAFAALAHAIDGTPPPAAAAAAPAARKLLAGLWRGIKIANSHKEVFWRLLLDGLPTAERRHTAAAAARHQTTATSTAAAPPLIHAAVDQPHAPGPRLPSGDSTATATLQQQVPAALPASPAPAAAPGQPQLAAPVAAAAPASAAGPALPTAALPHGPGPPELGELCACGQVRNPGREHHYWHCPIAR